MHNARKEMRIALRKLAACLCLIEPNESRKIEFFKIKLNEVLDIEEKCPGALPGRCLKHVKEALKILEKTGDWNKSSKFISEAMNIIWLEPMMRKTLKKR